MSFLRLSSVGTLPADSKLKRGEVLLQYTRVLQPPDYTPIPFNQQQVKTMKADLSWTFTRLMRKIHKHDGSSQHLPHHVSEIIWAVEQAARRKEAELEEMKRKFKERFTGVKGLTRFGHKVEQHAEEEYGYDEQQQWVEDNQEYYDEDDQQQGGQWDGGEYDEEQGQSHGQEEEEEEDEQGYDEYDNSPPPHPPSPPMQVAPPDPDEPGSANRRSHSRSGGRLSRNSDLRRVEEPAATYSSTSSRRRIRMNMEQQQQADGDPSHNRRTSSSASASASSSSAARRPLLEDRADGSGRASASHSHRSSGGIESTQQQDLHDRALPDEAEEDEDDEDEERKEYEQPRRHSSSVASAAATDSLEAKYVNDAPSHQAVVDPFAPIASPPSTGDGDGDAGDTDAFSSSFPLPTVQDSSQQQQQQRPSSRPKSRAGPQFVPGAHVAMRFSTATSRRASAMSSQASTRPATAARAMTGTPAGGNDGEEEEDVDGQNEIDADLDLSAPKFVKGAVSVQESEEDRRVEQEQEVLARDAELIEREPPRPYGFLPFLRITTNGFTKEVRIPSFGHKYIDPPIGWLRERYRFAAPSGVNAFVALHAYGYVVYAKNNVRF